MKKIFFLSLLVLFLFFLVVDEVVASSPPFANARVVDEAAAVSPPFAIARVVDFGLAAIECDPPDLPCQEGEYCRQGKCVEGKALELNYPVIPGATTPKIVQTGAPEYIDYIFRLAIVIIGFVIFGALVYAGINYLAAASNPEKVSEAREGIAAAFLGAVILLSSWIIFNTINPQLTILELPPADVLVAVVTPGIYVCDYNLGSTDILGALETYINAEGTKTDDQQNDAAKKLREIMDNPEKGRCPLVNFSGNTEGSIVRALFFVPTVKIVYNGDSRERKPVYEYGIIFHQKEDFRGTCSKVFPPPDNFNLIYTYGAETRLPMAYTFDDPTVFADARSFTVFKKPLKDPSGDAKGIILFTCLDYNRTGMCPDGVDPNGDGDSFDTNGGDIQFWNQGVGLSNNIRSVRVDPKDGYFGIVFTEDDQKGECAIIKSNDPNILDMRIKDNGECNKKWWTRWMWFIDTSKCAPAIQSIIVIKGGVL